MHIRKAAPSDKEEIIKLIKEFNQSADNILTQKQRLIRAYTDLNKTAIDIANKYLSNPQYLVFVASENEVLKGFISGEIKYKEYRVYNKEGYVGDWFVENAYQGQGIGKALFDMLVKEFIKANCTHIALDTHLENEKAIKIYEDRGFIKRLVTFFKPLKDLS